MEKVDVHESPGKLSRSVDSLTGFLAVMDPSFFEMTEKNEVNPIIMSKRYASYAVLVSFNTIILLAGFVFGYRPKFFKMTEKTSEMTKKFTSLPFRHYDRIDLSFFSVISKNLGQFGHNV